MLVPVLVKIGGCCSVAEPDRAHQKKGKGWRVIRKSEAGCQHTGLFKFFYIAVGIEHLDEENINARARLFFFVAGAVPAEHAFVTDELVFYKCAYGPAF